MKKIVLLAFLLTMVFAEPLVTGKAYIVSSININSTGNIETGQSYSLVPQIVIATGSENYAGSVTPFTGCYGGKRYEKGSETGNCLTGVVNSLNSDSTTDALSAAQGKVLNDKVKNLQNITRINYLKPTIQTQTVNGVTITNNGDGTYILNGTATDAVIFNLAKNINFDGTLKLVGSPNGGSLDTYRLCYSNNVDFSYKDYGDGVLVNHLENVSGHVSTIDILIKPGTVCNNLLFKPMLTTDLYATYDDFVPYQDVFVTNDKLANTLKTVTSFYPTGTSGANPGWWYKIGEFNAEGSNFDVTNFYLFKRRGLYSINLGQSSTSGLTDDRNNIDIIYGGYGGEDVGLKWENNQKLYIYAKLWLWESYTCFNFSWESYQLTLYDEPILDTSITSADLKLPNK